ncbi:MAG: alpha/beta fold hydrolase, partial [Pseudomonadota bacterium]
MNSPSSVLHLHTDSIGTGPDLVILHGLFGSGENWRNQARKLSAHFTVHSMDARNHGDSPHQPAMSYPLMADDVIATCNHLQLDRICLLGHSMGGKTAMQIALKKPELIDRLIIVDIGPQQYPHHHDRIVQGLQTLQRSPAASRRAADEHLSAYVEDKFVRAFLLK